MSYFKEFPFTQYNFQNNDIKLIKNISFKPELVEKVKNNRAMFESYIIKEGDTVELIANQVYGDPNLHWAVMIANNMVSPYFDMPQSPLQFDEYIFQKYKNQIDSDGNNVLLTKNQTISFTQFVGTTQNNFNTIIAGVTAKPHHFIDSNKVLYSYDYIVNNTVKSNAFKRVEIAPVVSPVSIYDYEDNLNEEKRSILLLKKSFVDELKNEFKRVINE